MFKPGDRVRFTGSQWFVDGGVGLEEATIRAVLSETDEYSAVVFEEAELGCEEECCGGDLEWLVDHDPDFEWGVEVVES